MRRSVGVFAAALLTVTAGSAASSGFKPIEGRYAGSYASAGHRTGPVRITGCADDQCVTEQDASVRFVFVRLDSVTSVRSVPARLTVEAASGVVFNATTTVTLYKVQPNGPRCRPTAYQGSVRTAADGTLKPT